MSECVLLCLPTRVTQNTRLDFTRYSVYITCGRDSVFDEIAIFMYFRFCG